MTDVIFNHLNLNSYLALEVTSANGVTTRTGVENVYDATGVKQERIITQPSGLEVRDVYVNGYIYQKIGNGNEILQMFSQPEGYVEPINATDYSMGFNYGYNYVDHLGNTRLTYSDVDGDGEIDASTEIISEKNYYPFGLQHKGYNSVISANKNTLAERFAYNGKESIGNNWYDFGARNYHAALGRWFVIDPVADVEPSITPYRYAFNNPLSYIDPDGKYEWRINTETGSFEKIGNEGGDENQHLFFNDAEESNISLPGSDIFVGAVKTEGGEDGDIGFEVSTVDLWSDLPDEYQGAYTSKELQSRYKIQQKGGGWYDTVREQESKGVAPNDQYWNLFEYGQHLIHTQGNDSGLAMASDTGMLQEIVGTLGSPGPMKITNRGRKNNFSPQFSYSTSTPSTNPWIRFLQANKGKYKGKGYGRGWIKKAAQDYQIAKQKK